MARIVPKCASCGDRHWMRMTNASGRVEAMLAPAHADAFATPDQGDPTMLGDYAAGWACGGCGIAASAGRQAGLTALYEQMRREM